MDKKETKFIPLSKAAKEIGRTSEHLNLLVRQGKLKAEKLGRNWYTKKEWVDEFFSSKKKPEKKKQLKSKSPSDLLKNLPLAAKASFSEKVFQAEKPSHSGLFEFKKTNQKSKLFLAPEKKTFWPQLVTRIFLLPVFFVVIFFTLSIISFFLLGQGSRESFPLEVSEDSFLTQNEEGIIFQPGKVMGEETTTLPSAIAASENFRLKEFSFGGIVLASTNEERLPLEITDFKTKVFMTKDGKEAQALISWRTNKLAASEIKYAKINSQAEKKLQEINFAFNHSVILAALDLDTTYVITVQAQDRWGNTLKSDKFSVYTGSKSISVFDLIVKEINAVFGWAMK